MIQYKGVRELYYYLMIINKCVRAVSINPEIEEKLKSFEEKSTPYYAMLGQYVPITRDENLFSKTDTEDNNSSDTQMEIFSKNELDFPKQEQIKKKPVENPIKPSSHKFNIYEGDFFNYTTISRKEYYRLVFRQRFAKIFDMFSSPKQVEK